MDIDKDWIRSVLLQDNRVNEVIDIKAEPAVGENENYGSTLYRLRVKLKMTDDRLEDRTVILKTKTNKPNFFSSQEEESIFETENKIYSQVFTAMEKLLEKIGEEELLWPRYLGHKKLYLLMEDLTEPGFKLYPKEKPLDEVHTRAVMTAFGRLHGLGLVAAQRALVPVADLRTQFMLDDVMVFPKFYSSGVQGLLKVMRQWGPEWADKIGVVEEAGDNIWRKLKVLAGKTTEGGPCAFNHGDCWTNNILFKYNEGSTRPAQIKLVDFQMGHFNSPAWDLTYFFYNALLPQERYEKMSSYLDTYAASMKEILTNLSFKGRIPTSDSMLQAVKDLSYYGFLNSITIRPLLIASKDEGYHLESEKLKDSSLGVPQCIHQDSFYTSPEIHQILKDEITQYLKLKEKNQN